MLLTEMKHWLSDVKYSRFIFYITNILGWGSLAVGIWLYTEDSFTLLAPSSYSAMSAAGLCISSGAMVLIIAFIGVIGLWIQSKRLLIAYFCFVCLLFLVQCTTGIMGFLYKDAVRERVKYSLYATINHTYAIEYGFEKNIRITWDYMQTTVWTYWHFYINYFSLNVVVSTITLIGGILHNGLKIVLYLTDNKDSMQNCGKSYENERLFYKELFTDQLLQHMYILGIVALLFAIVEIIILTTSIRILHYFRKQEKRSMNEPACRFSRNNGDVSIHDSGKYSLIASTEQNSETH